MSTMTRCLLVVVLLSLLQLSSAWMTPSRATHGGAGVLGSSNAWFKPSSVMRGALAGVLLGSGALSLDSSSFENFALVKEVKAAESVFVGNYNDPNHPGCLRKITVSGKDVTLIGSDELDGSSQWVLKATEDYPGTIFVDFSPKGGPENLLGVFDEKDNGIRWPDKNLWSKLAKK